MGLRLGVEFASVNRFVSVIEENDKVDTQSIERAVGEIGFCPGGARVLHEAVAFVPLRVVASYRAEEVILVRDRLRDPVQVLPDFG